MNDTCPTFAVQVELKKSDGTHWIWLTPRRVEYVLDGDPPNDVITVTSIQRIINHRSEIQRVLEDVGEFKYWTNRVNLIGVERLGWRYTNHETGPIPV